MTCETFSTQNFNLGIVKMSVIAKNPLLPNPVLPKTYVMEIMVLFSGKKLDQSMVSYDFNHDQLVICVGYVEFRPACQFYPKVFNNTKLIYISY